MEVPRTDKTLRPAEAVQVSFAGGMRDRDHPSLLAENEYAYGKDIAIRDGGLAETRDGRTQKTSSPGGNPQGAMFFQPLGGTAVVVQVNDGRIYTWNGTSTSWVQLGVTRFNNTTGQVTMRVLNGKFFIFAGSSDNVVSWDGVAAFVTDEGNTNTDPPRTNISTQQEGRLVGASNAGAAVDSQFFSDIFDGTTWDRNANNKRTPTDGSEPITAMATYRKQEILVWTRNSTHSWSISGSTVSGFTRISLDSKIGCIALKSPVVVGDDAFFLDGDLQVRTIKRTAQDIAFGVSIPITFQVPNLFKRINASYASLAAGGFFNNYYLLSVPLDNNTRNSATIAFDTLHQIPGPSGAAPVCVGEWTNIKAAEFFITNFGGVQQLHYIDANDGSAYLMFDGETDRTLDTATTIDSEIQFRAADWRFPQNDKTLHSGELQFIDTYGQVTIAYARDDAVFNNILTDYVISDPTQAILPITLPFTLPSGGILKKTPFSGYRTGRSRYWQIKMSFENGRFSLKQFLLRSWVENLATK